MIDKEYIGKESEEYKLFTQKFKWPFWLKSTQGVGAMRDAGKAYLFQHPREEDDEWEIRAQTTEYVDYGRNQAEFIVSRIAGMGFQAFPFPEGTEKNSIPEEWQDFLDDCDGQGTPLDRWLMIQMFWSTGIGTCVALVEMPRVDQVPTNRLEAQEKRFFPRLTRIWPWEIINADPGSMGIEAVVIRERKDKPVNKEKPDAPENFTYLYYNREVWERWEAGEKGKTKQMIGSDRHDLGEIPLVFYNSEDVIEKSIFARPLVENSHISGLCLYNLASRMEQLSIEQGFALGYYQGTGKEQLDIGPNRMVALPKETSIMPGYVSPGTEMLMGASAYYDKRVNWLDMMTHQGVSSIAASSIEVAQSGISKLMDQEDPTHFLREVGQRFVKPIQTTFRLLWQRLQQPKRNNEFIVVFPQRFALKDAGTVVNETNEKLDLFQGSQTARTLLLQSAAEELMGRLATTQQLDQIKAELQEAQQALRLPEEEEGFQATGL